MNNTPQETEDPVTTYLKDNSRKKSYAEATLDAVMHETELENAITEVEAETKRTGRRVEDEVQPKEEDHMNEAEWEIHVLADLKRKMSGLWQTSIILKLMGKQLGYRYMAPNR
uniref:Uncharacterized protein n=1 Tax=Quercus lobata TaxID=97700 RepID=A0A7N2M3A2_QUELO